MWPSTMAGRSRKSSNHNGSRVGSANDSRMKPVGLDATAWTWICGSWCAAIGTWYSSAITAALRHVVSPPAHVESNRAWCATRNTLSPCAARNRPSSTPRAAPPAGQPLSREATMARVAPITGKSDVPAEHQAVVDSVLSVFGNVRGPFSMLLHSPKLAERVLPLVSFFRDDSVVDARLRSV